MPPAGERRADPLYQRREVNLHGKGHLKTCPPNVTPQEPFFWRATIIITISDVIGVQDQTTFFDKLREQSVLGVARPGIAMLIDDNRAVGNLGSEEGHE
jgi:hypothetical protein